MHQLQPILRKIANFNLSFKKPKIIELNGQKYTIIQKSSPNVPPKSISSNLPSQLSRQKKFNTLVGLNHRDLSEISVVSTPLPTSRQIVVGQLNNLEQVRDFLLITQKCYQQAKGNLPVFRRLLSRHLNLMRLFNILVGERLSFRYVTRDPWDTLAFHLLLAWCQIYGLKYQTKHLINLISELKKPQ